MRGLSILILASGLAAGNVHAQNPRVLPPLTEMSSERRVALVVGNSAYEHAIALESPAYDAQDMAQVLRRVGFEVVVGTDLTERQMREALTLFVNQASDANVVLFFYAGHGVEIRGQNYLLPIEIESDRESAIISDSIPLSAVLDDLADLAAGLRILSLDTCRDNPFRAWRSLRGGVAGASDLANSVTSFATLANARASDNVGDRNGLYTEALLIEIVKPGVNITEMFRHVGSRVQEASGGRQLPQWSSTFYGQFYFVPTGREAAPLVNTASLNAQVVDAVALFDREEYAEALSLLEQAADQGHAEAQSVLGYMLVGGVGVEPDLVRGAELLQAAASQGHVRAQVNLGLLYANGWGVERDVLEAVRLYEAASEEGQPEAQNNLGVLYEKGLDASGRGVPRDTARAADLYRMAAASGLATAHANLGHLLEGRDAGQAAAAYREAANRHRGAAYRLATLLVEGRGVERNLDEARRLLQPIAEAGHEPSISLLATLPEARPE